MKKSSFVDSKWASTARRKRAELEGQAKMMELDQRDQKQLECVSMHDESSDEMECNVPDIEYTPERIQPEGKL